MLFYYKQDWACILFYYPSLICDIMLLIILRAAIAVLTHFDAVLQHIFKYQNQIQLYRQIMNTNKYSTLYIKQFFTNFIIRKNNADNINLLSSSLEVLSQLIDAFIIKHSIPTQNERPYRRYQYETANKMYNSKQINFDFIFEDIYEKMRKVFQWVEIQLDKSMNTKVGLNVHDDSQLKQSRMASTWAQPNDEQLYQILNQYKIANKKLKQTNSTLTKRMEQKNSQFLQLKISKEISEKQIVYLNSRIKEFETQLDQCKQVLYDKQNMIQQKNKEISALKGKIKSVQGQFVNANGQNKQTRKYVEELEQKFNKVNKQKGLLQKQIKQLKQHQLSMVNKKIEEIPKIIQSKLKDKRNWDQAALEIVKNYISYSSKQNNSNNLNNQV